MPKMVEFGTLKRNTEFDEPVRDILFGGESSRERYRKIQERVHEGRLINAKVLDDDEYCWIAPSHRVYPV